MGGYRRRGHTWPRLALPLFGLGWNHTIGLDIASFHVTYTCNKKHGRVVYTVYLEVFTWWRAWRRVGLPALLGSPRTLHQLFAHTGTYNVILIMIICTRGCAPSSPPTPLSLSLSHTLFLSLSLALSRSWYVL